jgi:hypothetical protein
MPFLFYLPFIIATGMFTVATESLSPAAGKSQPSENKR